VVDISFNKISRELKKFEFPPFDIVVGIARGGVVPAMLIAHQFDRELVLLTFNYRDDTNQPRYDEPVFLSGNIKDIPKHKKILLVDDVSVSGKTLNAAKALLRDYQVTTFALKGKADLALFTDIRECVNWPWKT